MNCVDCQNLMIDFLYEELEEVRTASVSKHLDGCGACRASYDQLVEGQRLGEELPIFEPSAAVSAALLEAARIHAEASRSDSREERSSGRMRWLFAFLRGATGPQVAMATVMLLVVAVGLMYIPQANHSEVAVGRTVASEDSTGEAPVQGAIEPEPMDAPAEETEEEAEDSIPAPPPVKSVEPRRLAQDARQRSSRGSAPSNRQADRAAEAVAPPAFDALSSEGRYERGLARYRQGEYGAAIEDLSEVVARPGSGEQPLLPSAIHHLARSYRANGACQSAVPQYERLVEAYPTYAGTVGAVLELAECYRRIGQLARAEQWYMRAAQNDATRVVAQRELLRLQSMRHASRRSVAEAERPAPAAPEDFADEQESAVSAPPEVFAPSAPPRSSSGL